MKKYLFTFSAALLILLSFNGLSQNLLVDGDFSKTTDIQSCDENVSESWCEFSLDYSNSDATVVDEVCNYHVTELPQGTPNWGAQLIQFDFNLESEHMYNLTFDVKADKPSSFGVFLGENGGSWINLLGFDRYWHDASTEWQTISMDFKSPVIFASYKLSFEFGQLINNTVFIDNVSLTDKGIYTPEIGIIGDAVFGWNDGDAFMETTDGEIYTLSEFPLSAGELIFRQDGDWILKWGSPWNQPPAFPDGIAVQNGQNIPIPTSGNYDIMFNRSTGEYHFTCVSNCAAEIGITGTAVPPFFNWDDNYKMKSPDGENYFIPIRYFGDGEVKFRQLDNWDNNWGGSGLHGIAIPEGNGIPVMEAFYTVHFNINSLEYHFDYPFFGMVGSALEGWDNDIPMETEDGIHYILNEHFFNQGEVKFRANHNWRVNFGTYWDNPSGGFPSETAVRNQMNIFVPAGVFTVSFNLQTKEYSFEGTPCMICPQDIYVFTESDKCGAVVEFPELSVNEICGTNFTVEQLEGLPSGSLFPPGQTHQAFIAYNDEGKYTECHFNVFVEDNVPPEIVNFTADYEMPWPPNHQMIPVTLNYEIIDVCDGEITKWLNVWCNEEDEKGAGNTSTDFKILDDYHVLLRAERSGKEGAREYHIVLGVIDENQNHNIQEVVVKVEHDMRKSLNKSAVIDKNEFIPFNAEIWPNPAHDEFYIKINSIQNRKAAIIIYDMNGRIIQKNIVQNNIQRFGSDLLPGFYILQLQTSCENKTFKIVKK